MNIHGQTTTLSKIIARYFVSSRKAILHHGDCDIYRADRPFCGCGLIHDLNYLDFTLAEIVYPKFMDDAYLQQHGKKKRRNKKKDAECIALLESVFGKIEPPCLEDIKLDYDDLSKILDICCTKTSFPSAYRNLKKWLHKKVSRASS
jgi:hypothetical protein